MSMSLGNLAQKWAEIKLTRAKILDEAWIRIDEAQRRAKIDLASDIQNLVRARKATKVAIAGAMGVSRTTLDNLLKEFASVMLTTYRIEQHDFGRSVWIRGVLPDNGGFPFLQGEMGVRFVFLSGNYRAEPDGITGPEYKGVKEFMTTRYSAEVLAWALENGVVKPEEVKTVESVDTEVSDW